MQDAYREDLAYVHDAGFRNFIVQASPGLLQILRGAGVADGLVVDLGCGSGIWARALCDAGYQALGIDISPAMLKLARRAEPRAKFQAGSFLQAQLPQCAAITAVSECLNYCFDPANNPQALAAFFARVYDALRPGGVFVFDMATPGRSGGPGVRQKNVEGPDWAILLRTEETAEPARLTRHITLFRRKGKLYRRSEEVHVLHLMRGAELAALLRPLGFRVRLVRAYGKLEFPKGLVGVIAQKPRTETD